MRSADVLSTALGQIRTNPLRSFFTLLGIIATFLTSYTRAIDTGDWDRLDAVFTPDASIDYTSTGGIAGAYVTPL